MFSDKVTLAIVAAAKQNGIDPAPLLALVETETGGDCFEVDGRTPQLLYERHVAWKEAGKVSARLLAAFRVAGLAIPKWDRATQYRDQRTSAQRLQLIRQACAINDEVALRSASHGLGQTMGFLAESLGYASARAMVDAMTGSIDGQIDGMIREIKRSHLVEPLNARDWPHVARVYNGPGYAANRYDVRMKAACQRWDRRLETMMPGGAPREVPPEQGLSRDEVKTIQTRLAALGYHEVGSPDGRWGTKTTGAVSAFQAHEGLPVNGHFDEATRAALDTATAREVSPERATATPEDLAGSRTVAEAAQLKTSGDALKVAGAGGAAAAGADSAGWLDTIKDHFGDAKDAFDALGGAKTWLLDHWWLVAIAIGIFIVWRSNSIVAARVEDHQTGRHAGPAEA